MKKPEAKNSVKFDTPKTIDITAIKTSARLKPNEKEPFCFLNVFKPKGITSFDVIYKLRKVLGIKKIGHSGTLDPLAEGVLQIAVGKASRLLEYLGSDKKYIAKIKFGYMSETGDAEGDIRFVNSPNFSYEDFLTALNSMNGQIEQTPPLYSAVKVGGKKLCDLARKNAKKRTSPENNTFCNIAFEPQSSMDSEIERISERANPLIVQKNGNQKNANHCCAAVEDVNKISLKNDTNFSDFDKKTPENQNLLVSPNINLGVEIPKRNVTIYEAKVLSFVTIPKKSILNSLDVNSNLIASSQKVSEGAQINQQEQIVEAEVEIFCSKGTYVRSFAIDLAAKLNTGAYLTSLVRTQAGNFTIENSIKTEDANLSKNAINPLDVIDLPQYMLNEEQYKRILNGMPVEYRQDALNTFVAGETLLCKTTQLKSNLYENNQPKALYNKESILALVFQNTLVSIGILEDNKIIVKKVFK